MKTEIDHQTQDTQFNTPATDLCRRGTRLEGAAPVDTNGRPKDAFDATGTELSLDADGKLHPIVEAAPEPPNCEADSAEQEAAAVRLEIVRRVFAFVGLGQCDFKTVAWRAVVGTNFFFPHESKAALARTYGVSEATVREKLRVIEPELHAFLRANIAPKQNPSAGVV